MTEKIEFIDAEDAAAATEMAPAPTVLQVCGRLKVSRSGFYVWLSRPESATAQRWNDLRLFTCRVFKEPDGTYGYRRVAAELAR